MAEKNSLEEEKLKVEDENTKITSIMHKIYNEKNVMKKTMEQMQQSKNDDLVDSLTPSKNTPNIREKNNITD